jgi:hypothetical protein
MATTISLGLFMLSAAFFIRAKLDECTEKICDAIERSRP